MIKIVLKKIIKMLNVIVIEVMIIYKWDYLGVLINRNFLIMLSKLWLKCIIWENKKNNMFYIANDLKKILNKIKKISQNIK